MRLLLLQLFADRSQPAPFVFGLTIEQTKEGFLDRFSDWATAAFADLHTIYRAHWGDFGGSTTHEDFIRQIQRFTLQRLLADGVTQFTRQRHDAVTSDARQNA